MSIRDLETAFNFIEEYGGGDFEGKKTPALIKKAEKALGILFPPTYKKFLAKLGCGDFKGSEFYGLINDDFYNSSVPDAVWLTLSERKSGFRSNLIIVYATYGGIYYVLDSSQANDSGEYPVLSYEPDGRMYKVANDYGAFLLSELKLKTDL